ncbi:hypothetical protein ACGFJC_13035 [Nonomuraea fuscirosea]|uniref:hypothetical protein n=1 Tax=Nonomuraea fuscirosea TaxID=1291556 RepID=UPI0034926D1E
MTPAQIRAELVRLHAHIDAELDDEHRDTQYVLEHAAADLHPLITAIDPSAQES